MALGLSLLACSPAGENGPPGAAGQASPPTRRSTPSFAFDDRTNDSGVDFTHDHGAAGRHHYVETMAPGVALFDADGDGDLDLYVVDGGPLPGSPDYAPPMDRLYLNRGDGTFEDVTTTPGSGDTAYGMGVVVADYDGDGDRDLYVLNYGPNALFRNDGSGRFERLEVGAEDPTWSVSGAFLDYDGDLDLDLYVANYLLYDVRKEGPCRAGPLQIYCSPEQFPPTPDRFYENRDGRFVDVSRAAGVVPDTRGMGVAVGDLDGDGDQDIYITNDRSRNLLYFNERGRFSELATEAGIGYSPLGMAEGGMGAVIADLIGDGRPAIFHTNFQKEPNRLYVPSSDIFFDDRSHQSGLGSASQELVSWGIAALDVEGDGDLDLAVGNGHVFDNAAEFIPGSAHALPDHLYLNDGTGRFSMSLFPGPPLSSRGVASGDLDGDGDPDLVIASVGNRLRIWRNEVGRPERFLLVRLVGRPPNTDAYGARVIAQCGARAQHREVASGGSYASHSDSRVYLGLSEGGRCESVEVRWPDGTTERASDLPGGQEIVWRQGDGIVSRRKLAGVGP